MTTPMRSTSNPLPSVFEGVTGSDMEYSDAFESWDHPAVPSGVPPYTASSPSLSPVHSSASSFSSSSSFQAPSTPPKAQWRRSLGCQQIPILDTTPIQTIDSVSPAWVLKWSKDGEHLLSAGADGVVRIWKRGEGNTPPSLSKSPLREWRGHTAAVTDAAWTASGLAVSSSMDRTVRVWSTESADCVTHMDHPDMVTSVTTLGDMVATGCLDNHVRAWQVSENGESRLIGTTDVGEFVTSVCSVDIKGKNLVVAGTDDGVLVLIDVTASKVVRKVTVRSFRGKRSKEELRKVVGISVSGMQAFVTCADCRVRVFEVPSLRMVSKLRGVNNRGSVSIRATTSPGGAFVVSPSEESKLLLWGTSGTPVVPCAISALLHRHSSAPGEEILISAPATCATFFAGPGIDGRFIIAADNNSRICVYDRLLQYH